MAEKKKTPTEAEEHMAEGEVLAELSAAEKGVKLAEEDIAIEATRKQFSVLKERFEALSEEEKEEFYKAFTARQEQEEFINELYKNANITTYSHHGAMVQVRRDMKGKHREHTLCYQCALFRPNSLNNCHIAQAIFDNCVKFHVTTPVWECPSFKLGSAI